MKRILKAFGSAFAIGGVVGGIGFLVGALVPDEYGWLVGLCVLALVWGTCMAAAVKRRPLAMQAAVAVGVSWAMIAALSIAFTLTSGPDSVDWHTMPFLVVALPLAILATVSLASWAWWMVSPKRRAKPSPTAGAGEEALAVRPTASPAGAAQPSPKHLPGLWIICVLMGLGGMHSLATATTLTLPWALFRGTLAVVQLALAVGLWLRLRPAWYATLVLVGLTVAWLLVSGIRGVVPGLLVFLVGCLVYLALAFYLWVRRLHFGRRDAARPHIFSFPALAAVLVVLAVGVPSLLLVAVDEPRQSFPDLEAQVPVPPADENGLFLTEQMSKEWPLMGDEQLEKVWETAPDLSKGPSAEWVGEARTVLDKYKDCLAQARTLAAKPHFVEVTQLRGLGWVSRPMPWLAFTRRLVWLLAVSADVQAVDGHWSEAIDEADRVVALGTVMGRESKSMIQSLVALDVQAIGLASLRDVAGTVPDTAVLEEHLAPPLSEKELRKSFNLGMAGEFQGDVSVFKELGEMRPRERAPSLGIGTDKQTSPDLLHRYIRANPLIKVNVTANIFGRWMQQCLIRGQTYAPLPPDPFSSGTLWDIAGKIGYLRFARDPMGVIVGAMMLPANDRWVVVYYRTTATGRMTQLYLALRCYQIDHGKLPTSLGALAPQYLDSCPLDPFTGEPFGYEPGGRMPRIWSVGPNGVTDPLPTATQEGGDDIPVFLTFATKGPQDAG